MLDIEFSEKIYLHLKIPKSEQNVNSLVSYCKQISKEIFQLLFETILYKFQFQVLKKILGQSWKPNQTEPTPWECPRCGSRYQFRRRGQRKRKLKTSFGHVKFPVLQMTCCDCNKTFSPFPRILGIAFRQRLTRELEQKICSIIKDKSYGKTARTFKTLIDLDLAPTTIHRVVQKYGQVAQIVEDQSHIQQLQFDSTKINASENERGISVHLAISVGKRIEKNGRPAREKTLVSIEISSQPKKLKKKLKDLKIDQVNVDGASGLERFLQKNKPDTLIQRCLWHVPRTAAHMLYLDGLSIVDGRQATKPLKKFLFDEKISVNERLEKYDDFANNFLEGGYFQTYQFLKKARKNLFSYKRNENLYDRTISIVERLMREVNRRMENGSRWSQTGAENLQKLKFIEELNPVSYDYLWKLRKDPKSSFEVRLC